MSYFHNLFDLYIDMSFYIVIGLIFTGLLHLFVKREWIVKQVGKPGLISTIKASILGVPLPLCSCGVVPTAVYLGQNGASRGAVTSFLTSTPQTGIDSILATYGMMGPLFAIYRPLAAFCSGVVTGSLTDWKMKEPLVIDSGAPISCGCGHSHEETMHNESNQSTNFHHHVENTCCSTLEVKSVEASGCCCSTLEAKPAEASGCCCSTLEAKPVEASGCCCSTLEVNPVEESDCCCSSTKEALHVEEGCCGSSGPVEGRSRWKQFLSFTFGDFLDEISVNFVVGLLIAALITTLIPTDFLSGFTSPIFGMLLMLIVGIPMYVCSTASIPIAMSLIMKGISPGAAFVFLFSGPVTNIASLAMLTKTLGKATMTIYLGSVAGCALVFGLLLDAIIGWLPGSVLEWVASPHMHGNPMYMYLVGGLFGVALIVSLYRVFSKKFK